MVSVIQVGVLESRAASEMGNSLGGGRGQSDSVVRHIDEDVQRTADGRLFVFLEVVVDKAEDEG